MNEYQAIVNEVVGPLRASPRRKRRMNEELLCHLAEIEERVRQEGIAETDLLANVLEKFGDPDRVRADIQASIPTVERLMHVRFFQRKEGESDVHYVGRATLLCGGAIVAQACVFGTVDCLIKLRLPDFTWAEGLKIAGVLLTVIAFIFIAFLVQVRTAKLTGAGRWRRVAVESVSYVTLAAGLYTAGAYMIAPLIAMTNFHVALFGGFVWCLFAIIQTICVCEARWHVRRSPWKELGRDL